MLFHVLEPGTGMSSWQGTWLMVEVVLQVDGRGELPSGYFSPCSGPSEFAECSALQQLCQLISCLLVHPTDGSPSFLGCHWKDSAGSFWSSTCFGAT